MLTDLSPCLESDEVRNLLLALGYPTAIARAKVDTIIAEYQNNTHQPLLGVERDGKLVGLIGLKLESENSAVIRHIVVHPQHRRQGVGHAMIIAVCKQFNLNIVSAETDQDAVDFYRRGGFRIKSLGEIYPMTERFLCTLHRAASQ
jgi:ribosomal protein S18 acetylase RimI-like enzyme